MGKPTGFIEYKRQDVTYRPIDQRVKDYDEINIPLLPDDIKSQAARCMDCGVPFCHGSGCPLKNYIPDFNELVYQDKWAQACDMLHSTNNFPEITGRVCPAPCEAACTLAINNEPTLIRHIEFQIVEKGFENGWIKPLPAKVQTGKKIAVIGSGPAGLAAAQQLARAGHSVTVFEKNEKPGGLMRYGIPDFKLAKSVIDRRLEQLIAEGVQFQTGLDVGHDVSLAYLNKKFDAVCLTMGACQPRDLKIPGRELANIHFAMDFLSLQNKKCSGESINKEKDINAKGKIVVVIGGGDTGSDCVGTAKRQGAKDIYQFEILPKPPEDRPDDTPWPNWPRIMRTSSSHQEGCNRQWSISTKEFTGKDNKLSKLNCCKVEWKSVDGKWQLNELPDTEFTVDADLVLLAMGFVHVTHEGIVQDCGVELDQRGNIKTDNFMTTVPGIFSAGDTVMGASLIVRAIDQGRKAAANIDKWLQQK